MKRLLIVALFLAGCGGAGGDSTPSPVPSVVPAAQAPLATKFVPSPAPDVVFDLPVKLTKRTASVARNASASVTIETTEGAECGIDVQYKSGSSSAKGLEPKIANANGAIRWKWLVGRSESKGTTPIVIVCTLAERVGRLETSFKVK